ncbi:tRNA-U20-dihydrouridine synthase [Malonomonas rubra DSM 5091]|uniref:tRNA-dihydrouridine synthase n=1 Tax=Malonomonas rubra DSM 5091 TaxID=1122189 RepID=A0A1M6E1W3_MALRU|nr:tRNA dihydrouridine synthase DusB [Malonomonas rubra]SHI79373.1 tRNA-U20-dihydrouridine synthase [Malonomonas rubra DSM 5091]
MQITHPLIRSLQLENPIILAPMAGITSLPYRRVMKDFGAALVYTEMVSANGLIRDGRKTRELLVSCPEEAPLGVQLFGDDPQVLAEATRMIAGECTLLDINMGCPVKKVIRSGAGSALLKEPVRIGKIVRAVRAEYDGPLTVKIRSGWDLDNINFIEVGKIIENEGADAITLHPRTRSQAFGGKADWQQITVLKRTVKIPVIGSGDIFSADDGICMLQETGCDAIMIGRGGYGNPWLIRDILALLSGQKKSDVTAQEKLNVAMRHLQWHREQFGDRKTLFEMRKHLCWYARGLTGAGKFRGELQKATSLEQLIAQVENFYHEADNG